MDKKQWEIYLLECSDGSLYTGVSNDVARRIKMHVDGKGSKYVRSKGFFRLIGRKICLDKSEACKKEYYVKTLSKKEKLNWFRQV